MWQRGSDSVLGAAVVLLVVACGGKAKENSPLSAHAGSGAVSEPNGESGADAGGEDGNDADAGSGSGGRPSGAGGVKSSSTTGGTAQQQGGTDGGTAQRPGGSAGGTGGTSNPTGAPGFCAWGMYDTELTDDELTCEPWSECEPGTYVSKAGGYTNDQSCTPCATGRYSEIANASACTPWTKCALGEEVTRQASATQDRTCAPAKVFPPVALELYSSCGPLMPTDQGLRLFVTDGAPDLGSRFVVLSYPLTGDAVKKNDVFPPGEVGEFASVTEMISLTGEFIAVGMKNPVVDYTARTVSTPAFIRKLNANLGLVWDKEFGSTGDFWSFSRVASQAGALYAVGLRGSHECMVMGGADPWFNCGGLTNTELFLRVFDMEANVTLHVALETSASGEEASVNDLAVASNGHIYIALSRFVGASWQGSVIELSETGERVAEHPVLASRLEADEAGNVYALGDDALYRLGSSGWERILSLLNPAEMLSTEHIATFSLTEDGVILAGPAGDEPFSSPLLVRTDRNGKILSKEVFEDWAPAGICDVRQLADGRVFVAGYGTAGVFVAPLGE